MMRLRHRQEHHDSETTDRPSRPRRAVSTVAASALLLAATVGGQAASAAADTPTADVFGAAGTYYVTVPAGTSAITLHALGGAGFDGVPGTSVDPNYGGTAGSGTVVDQVLPVGPGGTVQPGDSLEVVVGAKGGGGQRGYGSLLGGDGGNGGGATYVRDRDRGNAVLVVAAGGGGGGGAGSGYDAYNGGDGGTDSAGQAGIGGFYLPAGVGGAAGGPSSGCDSGLSTGTSGESPGPLGGGAGGGGGGGGGACGGSGGGSGDHGGGDAGGGGGGGSGLSATLREATSSSVDRGSNSGDGTTTISYAVANLVAVTTSTLPTATIGEPYSATLAATGGVGPYTWTVITNPELDGLTLDPDGTISGTPAQDGPLGLQFQVQVTDAESPAQTATRWVTLPIQRHPIMVTTTSLPTATYHVPYSATLTASGAPDDTYAWDLVDGSQTFGTDGLQLAPDGTVSGQPAPSTWPCGQPRRWATWSPLQR
jgi:hypothetical protein